MSFTTSYNDRFFHKAEVGHEITKKQFVTLKIFIAHFYNLHIFYK